MKNYDKYLELDPKLVESKISSETVFDGHLVHLKKDMVRLPNGHEAVREWIKHPGASAVVPILPNGDVILVRQFRYPIGKVTLEVPAGKLDKPGEDPILCAERELSEETGYVAKKIWKLTTIATSFGFSDEWIHLYAAKDLTKGQQHPDEDEFINVVKMPLDDAVALIHEGKIYDSKSVVSILMLAEQLKNS